MSSLLPLHHRHTPVPPQAVVMSGILALGDPAHHDAESQGVSSAHCVIFRVRDGHMGGVEYLMKFKWQEKISGVGGWEWA